MRRNLAALYGLALGFAVGGVAAALIYVDMRLRALETLDPDAAAHDGGFVDVDGISTHYEVMGDGEPLVLLHGFGGSMFSWRHSMAALGERFRVYALDFPGFGYSGRTQRPVYSVTAQARFVHDFLDVLGEQRPVVMIGNSWGGAVALRFAVEYPARTRALILTAPSVFFTAPWAPYRRLGRLPWLGRHLVRAAYYFALARPRSLERMIAIAYAGNPQLVTPEVRDAYVRPIRVRGSADAVMGLLQSRDAVPLPDLLTRVTAPVLIIGGRRDIAVSLRSLERLHRLLPRSELVVFDDVGHLIQEEDPERFHAVARAFLSRHGVAAARCVQRLSGSESRADGNRV